MANVERVCCLVVGRSPSPLRRSSSAPFKGLRAAGVASAHVDCEHTEGIFFIASRSLTLNSRNGPCLKGVAREPLFCRKMVLNNYLEALLNLQMIKCFSICTGVKEMLVYLYLIFSTDGSFQENICTNLSFLCVKTAQLQSFLFDFTGHD